MDTWNNKADETLVALYAKGENQAFNVLLNRYKDKLYTYIYYIVRNSEMTEDIFQETFMKAIITIRQGRYNENGKFSAWMNSAKWCICVSIKILVLKRLPSKQV